VQPAIDHEALFEAPKLPCGAKLMAMITVRAIINFFITPPFGRILSLLQMPVNLDIISLEV
jgi:hypothetical protein